MANGNSTSKNVIILAPHVDDEVIGCYRLLAQGIVSDVVYFEDLTPERIEEAWAAADYFGFNPHFGASELNTLPDRDSKTFYAPNVSDLHPHHKYVNVMAKRLLHSRYYSVDMNVPFDVLTEEEQEGKKQALLTLYPSQRKLLESNDAYHLFESDLRTDLIITKHAENRERGIGNEWPNDVHIKQVYREIILNYPPDYLKMRIDDYTYEYKY